MNGLLNTDSSIDLERQLVTFNRPPVDGSEISVQYEKVDAKTLEYPLPKYANRELETLSLIDRDTRQAVQFEVNNSMLILDPEDVWTDRELTLLIGLLPKEEDFSFQIDLPPHTVPGSMKVKTLAGTQCGSHFLIDAGKLQFNCQKSIDEGLRVSYDFVDEFTNSFNVDPHEDPRSLWNVLINNHEYKNYEIHDGTLTIPEGDLEPGSDVVVRRTPPVRAS